MDQEKEIQKEPKSEGTESQPQRLKNERLHPKTVEDAPEVGDEAAP